MKQLHIVGAGGFGRELYVWAGQHPDRGKARKPAGVLDAHPAALSPLAASPPPPPRTRPLHRPPSPSPPRRIRIRRRHPTAGGSHEMEDHATTRRPHTV